MTINMNGYTVRQKQDGSYIGKKIGSYAGLNGVYPKDKFMLVYKGFMTYIVDANSCKVVDTLRA